MRVAAKAARPVVPMPSAATRIAAQALQVLPRATFSRAAGWASDLEAPRPLVRAAIGAFRTAFRVDVSEAPAPDGGWASLDAFFTRRLRPGARPFPIDPDAVPSPCDGRLVACGRLRPGATLSAKGSDYALDELLADPGAPDRYRDGSFAVLYLAPPDYHRVHAAAGGTVERAAHVPGERYPVNALGTALVPRIFARNERALVEQRDDRGRRLATVLVGALAVARIELLLPEPPDPRGGDRRFDPGPRLERGDELGVFHLGSTVVLVSEAPVAWTTPVGARVRAGVTIGRTSAPPDADGGAA